METRHGSDAPPAGREVEDRGPSLEVIVPVDRVVAERDRQWLIRP